MPVMTILHHASIFLYWPVSQPDIEQERQRLEAEYKKQLTVASVVKVKRHGLDCAKVAWEIV